MKCRMLKELFDHQYSEQNRELQKVIDTVHARYSGSGEELNGRQGRETDAEIRHRRCDPPLFPR